MPTTFPISKTEISGNFLTYGVEYSNRMNDVYIQFYVQMANCTIRYGPKLRNTWISEVPSCNNTFTDEAARCSYLAPFDNTMKLIMNIAVGGDWGGKNVLPSDYDAFDAGVEMEVSSVIVYESIVY